MSDSEIDAPTASDLEQLFDTINTSVAATTKSLSAILQKAEENPTHPDLDFSSGLTLLTVRPQLLLASLHQLVIMLGLRLSSLLEEHDDEPEDEPLVPTRSFSDPTPAPRRKLETYTQTNLTLEEELRVIREVMEKTKSLESKVSYQVKKLVALAVNAESAAANHVDEDDEEDEDDTLAYKPNVSALLSSKAAGKARATDEDLEDQEKAARRRAKNTRRSLTPSDEEEEATDGIYRAPRLGAIPYNEGKKSDKRADRRAPALLSEFADSLTNAPTLESTSGLSVRPVVANGELRSNSTSAKRMAELQRMTEFEEENMSRLVMRKRDLKRREEDEAALLMGYGVGGEQRSRSRKQGGFEAELEGVLGDRGNSKGMWDSVGKGLGKRDSMLDRSKKREGDDIGSTGGPKRRRFEKSVKKINKKR